MKKDESFGIIPFSQKTGEWRVFLIQHRKGGYWGFPKGHKEPGEAPLDAAKRELFEETNLEVEKLLASAPFQETYQFMIEGERIQKTVSYYLAEVTGDAKVQPGEIEDGRWFSLQEGIVQVTHREGKDLLEQVLALLEHRRSS